MLGNAKTSKNAWDVLNKAFGSKTRVRIMYLKEKFSRSINGYKVVIE